MIRQDSRCKQIIPIVHLKESKLFWMLQWLNVMLQELLDNEAKQILDKNECAISIIYLYLIQSTFLSKRFFDE